MTRNMPTDRIGRSKNTVGFLGGRGGARSSLLAALIFLILLTPALSTNQLVSLQGRVLQSGSPVQSGNIAVTIWSNQTGGALLYSDNFANSVSDGFFDLMLGASSELNLTYGTLYYLDLSISGQDMNWTAPGGGTVNRVEFQSTNGQIPPGQVQYNAINASHIAAGAINSSHLNSAGTYYMGKLGIGTTASSADLEIKSSSSIGAINITNGTGYPVFFVNASSGGVGIGTTNPSDTLQILTADGGNKGMMVGDGYGNISFVDGTSAANEYLPVIKGRARGGSGQAGLFIQGRIPPTSDSGSTAVMRFQSALDNATAVGTRPLYSFEDANSNSYLLIDKSGNVGIGTTGPNELLSIGFADSGNGGIEFRSSTYSRLAKIWANTSTTEGKLVFSTRSGGTLYDRMIIDNSGSVGIGTTSPGAKLHVDVSGNALSDPIPSYYSAGFTRVGNTAGGWTAGISIISGGTTNVGSSQINLGSGGDNDYTSITSNYQGTAAGDSNAYLAFGVAAAERMKIRGDGYVGINMTSPTDVLTVNGAMVAHRNGNPPLLIDRLNDDGIVAYISQDGNAEGTISVSGTTVSYNAFMGSHYTQLMDGQKELPTGTIVVSTGKILPLRNANSGNKNDIEKFPYVEKSSRRAQKGVYGVWFAKLSDDAKTYSFGDPDKPIYQIAAIGLYQIRVTDTAGNIENGDYIQASPRSGEGERQIDNDGDYQPYLMDKTVAKALVDVDWADVRADPEVGYKWKLIPATLHAG